MAERKRLGITARPLYSNAQGQRWVHPPRSMRATGSRGTDRAGFAGLADVVAELRELQRLAIHLFVACRPRCIPARVNCSVCVGDFRWKSAQEEAMRFLWEEVRQICLVVSPLRGQCVRGLASSSSPRSAVLDAG